MCATSTSTAWRAISGGIGSSPKGGGSLAHVDTLGLLACGPESAGADPGPACYGGGGTRPTVTDADLVLGYLDPGFFLGGEMTLDVEGAREAIRQHIAEPLGLSVEQAAWGIHRLVNEDMASAARVHAAERGHDATGLPLFAFGGAGPVHAFGVGAALGTKTVIVPAAATPGCCPIASSKRSRTATRWGDPSGNRP